MIGLRVQKTGTIGQRAKPRFLVQLSTSPISGFAASLSGTKSHRLDIHGTFADKSPSFSACHAKGLPVSGAPHRQSREAQAAPCILLSALSSNFVLATKQTQMVQTMRYDSDRSLRHISMGLTEPYCPKKSPTPASLVD